MQQLTFDILISVLAYIPSNQALRISTVCKEFHSIVIDEVFSRGIVLETLHGMQHFPQFIAADLNTRVPLLRALSVKPVDTGSIHTLIRIDEQSILLPLHNITSFLAQILTQYSHLRVLTLRSSSFLLEQYPAFRDALINNGGIVELYLSDVTEDVLRVISAMRSNLRVLSLYRYDGIPTGPFLPYITAHKQLEVLKFNARQGDLAVWSLEIPFQWPALRQLDITGTVPLHTLVAAFPNVRFLHALLPSANSPVPCPQWSKLDFLHGVWAQLHDWQISCPVRWLHLLDSLQDNLCGVPDDWYLGVMTEFMTLLERTTPMILSFDIGHHVRENFWRKLAPTLQPVKLLQVTIFFEIGISSDDERKEELSDEEEKEATVDVGKDIENEHVEDEEDEDKMDEASGEYVVDEEEYKERVLSSIRSTVESWKVSSFLCINC